MPEASPDDPGLLTSSATTLRLIVGWACFALGVLDLALGVFPASYVVFHLGLVVAGLLLLGLGRFGCRPGRIAWLAGGLVVVLGLIISALPTVSVECCSPDYASRHGLPFTILAHNSAGWHFDVRRLVADLVFWLCCGLVVLAVIARLRPIRPAASSPRPAPGASHAEDRRAHAADDENVRGLP
jgi:hypothetical protein